MLGKNLGVLQTKKIPSKRYQIKPCRQLSVSKDKTYYNTIKYLLNFLKNIVQNLQEPIHLNLLIFYLIAQ